MKTGMSTVHDPCTILLLTSLGPSKFQVDQCKTSMWMHRS